MHALILEAEDKPGALGDICRKIANNDVNIDFAYVASKSVEVSSSQ